MGGAAVFIPVTVRPDRMEAAPSRRTLVDRLLGRSRGPVKTAFGNEVMHELHGVDSTPVLRAFLEAIGARFPHPWAATRALRGYLESGVAKAHVRGYARDEQAEPVWRAEVVFSGCAGKADISAMAAGHWFGMWCSESAGQGRRDIFGEPGIEIDAQRPVEGYDEFFLPIGPFGYGHVLTAESSWALDDAWDSDDLPWPWSRTVEIDPATEKALSRAGLDHDAIARAMDALPSGKCYCQWCAPDFESGRLESLFSV